MTTQAGDQRLVPAVAWRGDWIRRQPRTLIPWALLGVLLAIGFSTSSTFRQGPVLEETLKSATFIGMASAAQFFVVVGGGIDLSVGAVASLAAMIGAVVMNGKDGNIPLAIAATLALGVGVGLVNGVLVNYLANRTVHRHVRRLLHPDRHRLHLERPADRPRVALLLQSLYQHVGGRPRAARDDGRLLVGLLVRRPADGVRQASVRARRRPRGVPPRRSPHDPDQHRLLCPLRDHSGCGGLDRTDGDERRRARPRRDASPRDGHRSRDRRRQPLRRRGLRRRRARRRARAPVPEPASSTRSRSTPCTSS